MGRNIVLGSMGFALWLATIFVALPAYGLIVPMSLEELIKGSNHIVIGKVVDMTCRWAEQWTEEQPGLVYTHATLAVEEYVKGESVGGVLAIKIGGGEITIPIPDDPETYVPPPLRGVSEEIVLGYWPVRKFAEMVRGHKAGQDSVTLGFWVEDTPEFEQDERVLVFLKGGESHFEGKPVFSPVGASQGKYTIVESKAVRSGKEIPLNEFLDRINKAMKEPTGIKQTSWGEVKFLFLLATLGRRHHRFHFVEVS